MKRVLHNGDHYGRLNIVEYAGNSRYLCICDCGVSVRVARGNIRSGNTSSCGCLRRETAGQQAASLSKTHGKSKTPEYLSWRNMLSRCRNTRCDQYANYGGRGITVCERWSNSFSAFLEDVGPKPSKLYSLERVDNDGNYEPSNCKWVTRSEQSKNRREFIMRADEVRKLRAAAAELEIYKNVYGPLPGWAQVADMRETKPKVVL